MIIHIFIDSAIFNGLPEGFFLELILHVMYCLLKKVLIIVTSTGTVTLLLHVEAEGKRVDVTASVLDDVLATFCKTIHIPLLFV